VPVGQRIVLENEHVRVWEINLGLGETIDLNIHYPLISPSRLAAAITK